LHTILQMMQCDGNVMERKSLHSKLVIGKPEFPTYYLESRIRSTLSHTSNIST